MAAGLVVEYSRTDPTCRAFRPLRLLIRRLCLLGYFLEVAMKMCNKCCEKKEESCFSRRADQRDGLGTVCKSCASVYAKSYYKRNSEKAKMRAIEHYRRARHLESHKAKVRERARRQREKSPEKVAARNATRRLKYPEACECCGAVGKVEAHHYLGYSKEHHLDVMFLCKKCHRHQES